MKKFIVFSAFLFLIVFSLPVLAQDENYQEEMMKAWTEYMTPGPMHELLSKGAGEWTSDIKMWMDPSQPPTESIRCSEIQSILGGRYFEGPHTSTLTVWKWTAEKFPAMIMQKRNFSLPGLITSVPA